MVTGASAKFSTFLENSKHPLVHFLLFLLFEGSRGAFCWPAPLVYLDCLLKRTPRAEKPRASLRRIHCSPRFHEGESYCLSMLYSFAALTSRGLSSLRCERPCNRYESSAATAAGLADNGLLPAAARGSRVAASAPFRLLQMFCCATSVLPFWYRLVVAGKPNCHVN